VSKFFQALENAERERAESASSNPESAATPAPAAAPLPSAETAKPAKAQPAPAAAPTPRAREFAPAPAPAPSAAPATATAVMEPPVTSAPTFGASIARSKKGGHAAIFDADEPGAPHREAGQLDDHLVSLLEPTGFAAEQYRTVRLAIENFRRERGLHVIAISSPGRREGKTISAINLAGALAQSPDARVALVDADLRHPRVADYLGITASRGLSGFLLDGSLTVDHVIEKPSSIAFSVVPAGAVSSMPYELLKSPRLAALFGALRTRFDYVVVDTPPVLAVPDVGILRDAVDGFVLVVRAHRTPREGLIDGLDTIGRHRVLGLVFNDDDRNAIQVSDGEPDAGWRKYFSFRVGGGLVD
jgi:capsular exopolysaccharide synthesis family protein